MVYKVNTTTGAILEVDNADELIKPIEDGMVSPQTAAKLFGNNREVMKVCVSKQVESCELLEDALKQDNAFLLELIKINPKAIKYIPPEKKVERDFLLETIKINPKAITELPNSIFEQAVFSKVTQMDGKTIPADIQPLIDDVEFYDFFRAAINTNEAFISFIKEEVIIHLVEQGAITPQQLIQYCQDREDLYDKKKILIKALEVDLQAIEGLGSEKVKLLVNDNLINAELIENYQGDFNLIQYAQAHQSYDKSTIKSIIVECAKASPSSLAKAKPELVQELVSERKISIEQAVGAFPKNMSMLMFCLKQKLYSISHKNKSLLKKTLKEVFMLADEQSIFEEYQNPTVTDEPRFNSDFLIDFFDDNKRFVKAACQENAMYFLKASADLRKDINFIKSLFGQNPNFLVDLNNAYLTSGDKIAETFTKDFIKELLKDIELSNHLKEQLQQVCPNNAWLLANLPNDLFKDGDFIKGMIQQDISVINELIEHHLDKLPDGFIEAIKIHINILVGKINDKNIDQQTRTALLRLIETQQQHFMQDFIDSISDLSVISRNGIYRINPASILEFYLEQPSAKPNKALIAECCKIEPSYLAKLDVTLLKELVRDNLISDYLIVRYVKNYQVIVPDINAENFIRQIEQHPGDLILLETACIKYPDKTFDFIAKSKVTDDKAIDIINKVINEPKKLLEQIPEQISLNGKITKRSDFLVDILYRNVEPFTASKVIPLLTEIDTQQILSGTNYLANSINQQLMQHLVDFGKITDRSVKAVLDMTPRPEEATKAKITNRQFQNPKDQLLEKHIDSFNKYNLLNNELQLNFLSRLKAIPEFMNSIVLTKRFSVRNANVFKRPYDIAFENILFCVDAMAAGEEKQILSNSLAGIICSQLLIHGYSYDLSSVSNNALQTIRIQFNEQAYKLVNDFVEKTKSENSIEVETKFTSSFFQNHNAKDEAIKNLISKVIIIHEAKPSSFLKQQAIEQLFKTVCSRRGFFANAIPYSTSTESAKNLIKLIQQSDRQNPSSLKNILGIKADNENDIEIEVKQKMELAYKSKYVEQADFHTQTPKK